MNRRMFGKVLSGVAVAAAVPTPEPAPAKKVEAWEYCTSLPSPSPSTVRPVTVSVNEFLGPPSPEFVEYWNSRFLPGR
jgi:hypothetical protein